MSEPFIFLLLKFVRVSLGLLVGRLIELRLGLSIMGLLSGFSLLVSLLPFLLLVLLSLLHLGGVILSFCLGFAALNDFLLLRSLSLLFGLDLLLLFEHHLPPLVFQLLFVIEKFFDFSILDPHNFILLLFLPRSHLHGHVPPSTWGIRIGFWDKMSGQPWYFERGLLGLWLVPAIRVHFAINL